MALIRHLPADAALHRATHGEIAAWGEREYLLAAAVDALRGANWQRAGSKGSPPEPWPRPKDEAAERRRLAERERLFRAHQGRIAERRRLIAEGVIT
jgi:hypothetical protein